MGVSISNRVGQVQVLRNGKGKGKREGRGEVARGGMGVGRQCLQLFLIIWIVRWMVKFSLHQFFSNSMFVQSQKGEVFGHLLLKSLGVDLWESATHSWFFFQTWKKVNLGCGRK